ncbi:MAG: hypothetical protein RQ743_06950 [Bacteroidales bacterium]|nr:hypothetical protein [Bacteroidales bacterium]
MKRYISLSAALMVLLVWGCSKTGNDTLLLKYSLERNVADINSAVNYISTTKAYEILSASSTVYKCEEGFRDSIDLDLIAGIYEFQPDMVNYSMFFIPYKLFEKTGESDRMIVNMPYKLIYHPEYLYNINPFDTLLENDFTINASDYHLYYSWGSKYDYKLTADFSFDTEDIGTLDIVSADEEEAGLSYTSEYTFNEGFKIGVGFQSGDSAVSYFDLKQDDLILLRESMTRVKNASGEKEIKYVLTIGNIDIVKGTGIDSIQVYLDGVLQQEAGAVIIDTNYYGASIRHERDILLTLDDGTTVKLGDMLKPAKKALAILVDSLHSMNFASYIINYIAVSIYYHS